jgi:hypothetical protein
MKQKIARRRRRRVNRSVDRLKPLQLARPLIQMQAIPQIASDADDARQAAGQIAKSDGLDEIVKAVERGRDLRKSRRFIADGDYKKDGRQRQRRIDALRVDRNPVPTFPRHPKILRCPSDSFLINARQARLSRDWDLASRPSWPGLSRLSTPCGRSQP